MRDVDLPGGAGRMALITLDNGRDHTRPSTFGPAGLACAAGRGRAASRPGRTPARSSRSASPASRSSSRAGADLDVVGAGRDPRRRARHRPLGHDVFRRLRRAVVPSSRSSTARPSAAASSCALHCTYRTVSSGVAAIALPECFLGLVPGWGGTYLLPNLVGPEKAVEVIIAQQPEQQHDAERRRRPSRSACPTRSSSRPTSSSSRCVWAGDVLTGRRSVERTPVDRDEQLWEGALKVGEEARRRQGPRRRAGAVPGAGADPPGPHRRPRHRLRGRVAGAGRPRRWARSCAPRSTRSTWSTGGPRSRRARRTEPSRDRSRRVGVVGAGLMASQLALLFVRRLQVPVVLTDLDQARVDKGVGYVHGEIDALRAKRRISPDAANRLKALVTGSTVEGRVRRGRPRDRGRLRGARRQEAGASPRSRPSSSPTACS